MDRYLNMIGFWTFPREHMCRLATICMLIAAKLEQPISPSFTRMINLLTDDEKKNVSKAQLIELEADILTRMGFDFNFPSPIQTMERFLRVLDYDLNKTVYEMSYQICKFQLNDAQFLPFRPSQIAACSVIISINIFERDQEIYKNQHGKNFRSPNKKSFFKRSKTSDPKSGLVALNTDIWNNPRVVSITGYTIEMLKEPLFMLAMFI